MKNKISFKIYSVDGKSYCEEIDSIYLDVPDHGIIGLLPGHTPFTAMLHISTFYIINSAKTTYFAISGGTINFKNNEAIILAQTYEKEDELDKTRIEKARDEALKILSQVTKNDKETYENASFSLKKAINRLKLLK